MAETITSSLAAVTSELRRRMGPIPSAGVFHCRCKRINGVLRCDKGYSQHAWGNAEDLKINGYAAQKPYVDELERMKRQGYPVGYILWAGKRKDHTDHIHVEGAPSMTGTPPCKGGKEPPKTTVDPNLPKGTKGGVVNLPVSGDAPEINIPLVGDVGPVLYRGMWITIAAVAVILVVFVTIKGLQAKVVNEGVNQAIKAVT